MELKFILLLQFLRLPPLPTFSAILFYVFCLEFLFRETCRLGAAPVGLSSAPNSFSTIVVPFVLILVVVILFGLVAVTVAVAIMVPTGAVFCFGFIRCSITLPVTQFIP